AEPSRRLRGVLWDAIAGGVHQCEVSRRINRSMLRRLGVPENSLGFVRRHPETRLTEDSHGFFSRDKTAIRGVLQQAKRFLIIHLQQCAGMVGEPQSGLSLGITSSRLGFQWLQIGDGQSPGFVEEGICVELRGCRARNLRWQRNSWRWRHGLRGLGLRVIGLEDKRRRAWNRRHHLHRLGRRSIGSENNWRHAWHRRRHLCRLGRHPIGSEDHWRCARHRWHHLRFGGEWLAVHRRFVSTACRSRTLGTSVCAKLDDEVVSGGAEIDHQLVSGNRALATLRGPEFDDHSCDGRRNPERGGAHSQDWSAIYNKALTGASQLTSGKIEYQSVRMLEPAHLRLHQLTERDFHINSVSAFCDRYGYDCRMRIAHSGTSGVL